MFLPSGAPSWLGTPSPVGISETPVPVGQPWDSDIPQGSGGIRDGRVQSLGMILATLVSLDDRAPSPRTG